MIITDYNLKYVTLKLTKKKSMKREILNLADLALYTFNDIETDNVQY